jgi:hypothetical protein
MALTNLERNFLPRLSTAPWASPPLFDHSLVARLVEAGYVQTETLPTARRSTPEPGRTLSPIS